MEIETYCDRRKKASPGNMQRDIENGRAPSTIQRVDFADEPFGGNHIHFKDGRTLNEDGTWRDYTRKITSPKGRRTSKKTSKET